MGKRENGLEWGLPEPESLRKPVRLTTVADEMEAGVMRSLLASCGIPSRTHSTGIGSYMSIAMGSNRYGIEIDVAEEDLEAAKEVLAAKPGEPADAPPEAPEEPEVPSDGTDEDEWDGTAEETDPFEEDEPSKKKTSFWLVFLLLLVPIAAAVAIRFLIALAS